MSVSTRHGAGPAGAGNHADRAVHETITADVPSELAKGSRVSTEGTFGPEVTSEFVPLGALQGPTDIFFLIGGVSPSGPHRDKH